MTKLQGGDSVSSPTSVLAAQVLKDDAVIEPIVLTEWQPQPGSTVDGWICPASAKSIRTINPIRAIVDPIAKNIQTGEQRGDGKDVISLALGDPTVGKNLPPCPRAIQEIVQAAQNGPHAAGYVNACGTTAAREAIARHHSVEGHTLGPDNVIIANGCSGALEIALTALLDPDTILLVPQPGFPLYQVIAESHGASVLHYHLDPDRHWDVDLDHLEMLLMKSRHHPGDIRGIVINNPSNPTGSVFSKSHLVDIVDLCQRYRVPIVSDEIYGSLVFGDRIHHPVAAVAAELGSIVPVITASGLAKQFLLPGWRIGWITFHDNIHGSLAEVEAGAQRLAQVILGASHLAQSAIPALLCSHDPSLELWKENLKKTLAHQAELLCHRLNECHGLNVVLPQGAMYAMVQISTELLEVSDDKEFCQWLLKEENVFVLPGSAFGMPNVFRVVFCLPPPVLEESTRRIAEFCRRHSKNKIIDS